MMKKWILLTMVWMVMTGKNSFGQAEHVFIITTDGLRWQELFGGMDTVLANDRKYHQGDSAHLYKKFWHADRAKRRALLMPFFWGELQQKGQLYGNRWENSKVDLANPHWISYPGYSELMTGYADPAISSNEHPANPHVNILEFLQQQPLYKNKVVAFAAWNAFDRILNEGRCGFPVFNNRDTVPGKPTPVQSVLNKMLLEAYSPWKHEALDVFTHYAAMEYIQQHQPKVAFISYGETDEWAHAGRYRDYLQATHQFDAWVGEIWTYLQSHPQYKNKTALFITTDHGRGVGSQWTSHGAKVPGASETWFAVLGKNVSPKGAMKDTPPYFTQQFAQTIADLLGITFKADHPIGKKIRLN